MGRGECDKVNLNIKGKIAKNIWKVKTNERELALPDNTTSIIKVVCY